MKRTLIQRISLAFFTLVALVACERIPVGYLQIEHGSYTIDSLVVYRHPLPTSARGMDSSIPWTSLRMEGIAGTKPIVYTFADVKATEGGDAVAFRKVVEQGEFVVQGGGILVLQQKALSLLPNGKYIISLRISNEGYTLTKSNVYTIIVKDKEEDLFVDYHANGGNVVGDDSTDNGPNYTTNKDSNTTVNNGE